MHSCSQVDLDTRFLAMKMNIYLIKSLIVQIWKNFKKNGNILSEQGIRGQCFWCNILQWLASSKSMMKMFSVRGRWTMGTNFHLTNTDERFPQGHRLGLTLSLYWWRQIYNWSNEQTHIFQGVFRPFGTNRSHMHKQVSYQ